MDLSAARAFAARNAVAASESNRLMIRPREKKSTLHLLCNASGQLAFNLMERGGRGTTVSPLTLQALVQIVLPSHNCLAWSGCETILFTCARVFASLRA